MAERLAMGPKELLREKVMELVKRGEMGIKAASRELKTSCRQGKHVYAAYAREGDKALVHGNAGKRSNRRINEAVREKAVEIYREKHPDFGPARAEAGLPVEEAGMRNPHLCRPPMPRRGSLLMVRTRSQTSKRNSIFPKP